MKIGVVRSFALVVILHAAFVTRSFSQEQKSYDELKSFSKWSIVAGPVLFDKATLSPQYGDLSFDNKPIIGFNAGFEYDFYPEKKWSIITGLILTKEPIYKFRYKIAIEDNYPHYLKDWVDDEKASSIVSFSVPIMIRLNIQVFNRLYVYLLTGLKAKYFPTGEAYFTVTMGNEDRTETREMFGLRLNSPENAFQGSFVIGTGCSYALDKVLLKANFIYVMNFQNTISGEYQFGNLFSSPPTRGYYNLSGNYLGLLFSASLKKGWGKR
ncbi:MAG: hypothetical protein FD155_533 [Bacteroidetes bacterium]|nr:MAG: hypothetical protein FD155_533 [Bacteroidota bacterium]